MNNEEITIVENKALVVRDEFSVEAVLERLNKIQDLMKRAMEPGVDFGQIPGTNSKPTLLKPGAEKIGVMFKFCPKMRTTKTFYDDGHLMVESTCQIYDIAETFLGEASALCTTKESKYAFRHGERKCPSCGKPAIIKGKEEFGGGWICWKKREGCGRTFPDASPEIIHQIVGRVPNENLADCYHSVVRIAEKRAYVAAIRLVTGSSALFDEESPEQEQDEIKKPEPVKDDKKAEVLQLIKAKLLERFPTKDAEAQAGKKALLQACFDVDNWRAAERKPVEALRAGLTKLTDAVKAANGKIHPAQVKAIQVAAKEKGCTDEQLKLFINDFQAGSLEELTTDQGNELLKFLQERYSKTYEEIPW